MASILWPACSDFASFNNVNIGQCQWGGSANLYLDQLRSMCKTLISLAKLVGFGDSLGDGVEFWRCCKGAK